MRIPSGSDRRDLCRAGHSPPSCDGAPIFPQNAGMPSLAKQLLMAHPRWRHNQGRPLAHCTISETQTIPGDAEPNLMLQTQNLVPESGKSTSESMLSPHNPPVKAAPHVESTRWANLNRLRHRAKCVSYVLTNLTSNVVQCASKKNCWYAGS